METKKEYKCEICNKNYSSYQTLWIHTKKFHKKIEKTYGCKYCDKIYKHQTNKTRHEKTCILNPNIINLKDTNDTNDTNLITENKELKKIINNLQSIIKTNKDELNIINNTTNNNNNNTTNNNTTNNNITNNTQNNINNVFVKFNKVVYDDIFTKKEIGEILERRFMALEESIKKVHFNPEKEHYQNIYVTNLEGKFAHVYTGGNSLQVIDKNELLEQLVDDHTCQIDHHKDMYIEKDPKLFNQLDKLVIDIIDEQKSYVCDGKTYKNFLEFKKSGLNALLYNNTDKQKFNKLSKMKLVEKE